MPDQSGADPALIELSGKQGSCIWQFPGNEKHWEVATMQYSKVTLKIQIIDDNEIDLDLLEAILRKMGFQNIVKSKTGEEAIRSAKKYEPDLFFIDIMLPGMSGGEFRELLKENPATANSPVIFISGIISKAEEKELGGQLKSGDVIIAKPFSKDRIAEAMVAALKKARGNLTE